MNLGGLIGSIVGGPSSLPAQSGSSGGLNKGGVGGATLNINKSSYLIIAIAVVALFFVMRGKK